MSALLGRMPSAVGYQPTLATEMGQLQERITSTRTGLGHLRPGDLRAGRRPHRPRAGEHVRPPRRDDDALARDRREGDLPGGRPARLGLARAPAGHRLDRALRGRDAGAADPAALQGPAGHHRDPRHGRAHRRGQARRLTGPQDRALPLAAELRRRAVHRHPGPVRQARGHDQGLPRDHRGQARRAARGRVLHGRPDRGRDREGGAARRPARRRPMRRRSSTSRSSRPKATRSAARPSC